LGAPAFPAINVSQGFSVLTYGDCLQAVEGLEIRGKSTDAVFSDASFLDKKHYGSMEIAAIDFFHRGDTYYRKAPIGWRTHWRSSDDGKNLSSGRENVNFWSNLIDSLSKPPKSIETLKMKEGEWIDSLYLETLGHSDKDSDRFWCISFVKILTNTNQLFTVGTPRRTENRGVTCIEYSRKDPILEPLGTKSSFLSRTSRILGFRGRVGGGIDEFIPLVYDSDKPLIRGLL
jgi:hypothetical protein